MADQLCYYEGYKAQAGETFEQQLKRQLVEDMKDRGRRLLRLKGGSTSPKAILRNMKGGIRWIMWLMFGSNVLMTPGVFHGIFPCDFSMAFPSFSMNSESLTNSMVFPMFSQEFSNHSRSVARHWRMTRS